MPALIEVDNLVKEYPGVRAVDGISFCVEEGACFGLLGPNGAGKTTTLEILEGITDADGGRIQYRGTARDDSYRQVIGIQFQNTALQDFQTVQEALHLFASLYPRHRPFGELIELCNLGELLDRDTRKLSGGQRQRLLLAIALVNDPDLVFLDEPTTGLDPQSRRNFWALIEGIRREGKTILLTTHYMEEASVLCDEIAIIDRGRIVRTGRTRGPAEPTLSTRPGPHPSACIARDRRPAIGIRGSRRTCHCRHRRYRGHPGRPAPAGTCAR